jgi:asparagine synthetase B (glutamine-hydrolysing)
VCYTQQEADFDDDLSRLVPGLDSDASIGIREFLDSESSIPVLQQLPIARTFSFLPYNAIPYVECNASANRIEPRFPYMDDQLVNLLLRVPFNQQYGRSHRHFMREALSPDILDASSFDTPLKGFSAPIDTWLLTARWREVIDDHLHSPTSRIRDLLDMRLVSEASETYYAGLRSRPMGKTGRAQPLGFVVWSLVAFEAWAREFL